MSFEGRSSLACPTKSPLDVVRAEGGRMRVETDELENEATFSTGGCVSVCL